MEAMNAAIVVNPFLAGQSFVVNNVVVNLKVKNTRGNPQVNSGGIMENYKLQQAANGIEATVQALVAEIDELEGRITELKEELKSRDGEIDELKRALDKV